MAYDENLATRVREQLSNTSEFEERKMFGGLCFMVGGHMCAGIVGPTLMVRVGPAMYEEALARPHARKMDFTGRPLTGMVYVDPPGIAGEGDLVEWIRMAFDFVSTLEPGAPGRPRSRGTARRTRRGGRR